MTPLVASQQGQCFFGSHFSPSATFLAVPLITLPGVVFRNSIQTSETVQFGLTLVQDNFLRGNQEQTWQSGKEFSMLIWMTWTR